MTTTIQQILEAAEKPLEKVNAHTVFGDPIESHGKTIIPVAKVSYGMVGGSRNEEPSENAKHDGAARAGGRIHGRALPLGALEITDEGTQFISFFDPRRIMRAAMIAFFVGSLMGRRRGRRVVSRR